MPDGGLHFNIAHSNIKQLKEFSISNLADIIKLNAPWLWAMLDAALSVHSTGTFGAWGDDNKNEWNLYWKALEGCNMRNGQSAQHLDRLQVVMIIASNYVDG